MQPKGNSMKEVSFNEHFIEVWEIARNKGYTQTEFLEKCGFQKQRFSHWVKGKQNLTGRSFIKLLEGVGVDCQTYESLTKRQFTPEQKEECIIRSWERKNRDLLLRLARDASLTKKVRNEIDI
jgi:transcriptional regulator with XRE-family HTH domain